MPKFQPIQISDERKRELRDRYLTAKASGQSRISRFLDLFLAGKAEAADNPEYADLAATVTATFAKGAWKAAIERGEKSPPLPSMAAEDEEAVKDIVMTHAYSSESWRMSMFRLARAIQHLGFARITPFTAAAAYQTFPHMSEVPYGR